MHAPSDQGRRAAGATPVGAWLLVLCWVLIIFVVSSQPDLEEVGRQRLRLDASSAGHVLFFGVLGFLVANALTLRRPTRLVWWTVVFVSVFAVLDELHQVVVPGRRPSIIDLAMDAFGGLTGAVAWVSIVTRSTKPADIPADQHRKPGGFEGDQTSRRDARQESPGR